METEKPKNKGGRPEGALSKLSREAREQAKLTGILPHEFLLSITRGEVIMRAHVDKRTGEITQVQEDYDFEKRMDAAKAAAPYYAPKISTVELISGASDNDLNQLIKELASQAGLSIGDGGDEQKDEATSSQGKRRRVALIE